MMITCYLNCITFTHSCIHRGHGAVHEAHSGVHLRAELSHKGNHRKKGLQVTLVLSGTKDVDPSPAVR